MMYSKRAFVHWFVGEGMEEGEFSEAREYTSTNLQLLIVSGIWQHWRKIMRKLQNHRNLLLKRNTKLSSLFSISSPFFSVLLVVS
jgi:hypothetical protein